MRHTFFAALAASAALVCSCDNTSDLLSCETYEEAMKNCELTVEFGVPETKVAAQTEANEKTIQNVQIFVFRAGSGADKGKLDVSASAGFDTPLAESSGKYSSLELRCSTGEREVWAVVNDAKDHTKGSDAIANKEQFLALTTELKDNTPTKLFMIGSQSANLKEGKESLTVNVKRVCASVILEKVTNDFISPGYQKTGVFKVGDCYLLNVPGKINFGLTLDPSGLSPDDWYARMKAESASPRKDLIYDAVTEKTVEYQAYDNTVHTFYAYPNNCGFSTDSNWSTRATVLVLETRIYDGKEWVKYYYPVALKDGLKGNCQYKVSLTVKRPGSLDPNVPVTFDDVTPVVTVSDWESGATYTPEV